MQAKQARVQDPTGVHAAGGGNSSDRTAATLPAAAPPKDQKPKASAAEAKRKRAQERMTQSKTTSPVASIKVATGNDLLKIHVKQVSPKTQTGASNPSDELALRRFQGLSPKKPLHHPKSPPKAGITFGSGVLGHLDPASSDASMNELALDMQVAREEAEAVAADTIHEAETIRRLAKVGIEYGVPPKKHTVMLHCVFLPLRYP